MKELKTAILLIVGFTLLLIIIKMSCDSKELQKVNTELYNELAKTDSIRSEYDGAVSRLTTKLSSFKELENENEKLSSLIDDKGASIRYWTNVALEWKERALSGVGDDTVYVDSSGQEVRRVDFEHSKGGIKIAGHTISPPGTYLIKINQKPIMMDIVLTQEQNGFRTYVDFHDEFLIAGEVNSNVKLLDPSFWDKFRLVGGIDVNRLGLITGMRYGSFSGGFILHSKGRSMWIGREWRIR